MNDAHPRKLYAYADETGQDTQGRLFIAATVVVVEEQARTRTLLERIEHESGKPSRKWTKATVRQRLAYIPAECDDLIALKPARYEYLQGDPARVRDVMEVCTFPLLIVRGVRPVSVILKGCK